MLLELSSDQEFFRDTTAKFLSAYAPVDAMRRLRDDPAGFDRDHWRRGAELGWTSLLVSERNGGGSVSGNGILDLTLIAYEFGHAAAPGPLVPTNIVATALDAVDAHLDVLADLSRAHRSQRGASARSRPTTTSATCSSLSRPTATKSCCTASSVRSSRRTSRTTSW